MTQIENSWELHREAENLLDQTTTNPCRRTFGFGHSISYAGLTCLPLIAAFGAEAINAPVAVTESVALSSLFPILAGLAGAVFRNSPDGDKIRAVNIEFAQYAAQQTQDTRHPVARSLIGGLKNGLRKNGVVYLAQTIAGVTGFAGIALGAAVKYSYDMSRALYLENKGEDPSVATSSTYADLFWKWEVHAEEKAQQIGVLSITDRDADKAKRSVSHLLKKRSALFTQEA